MAYDLDDLQQHPMEEVIFEEEDDEEDEPVNVRRSERESTPVERLTYSHAQAVKLGHHIHHCLSQTYNLNKGLREFGQEGHDALKKEIGQIHGRKGIAPTHLRDLTNTEADRALEALTILLRKK